MLFCCANSFTIAVLKKSVKRVHEMKDDLQSADGKALQFIEDVLKLYKKYELSISHEDTFGAFIIVQYSAENEKWLRNAIIDIKNE